MEINYKRKFILEQKENSIEVGGYVFFEKRLGLLFILDRNIEMDFSINRISFVLKNDVFYLKESKSGTSEIYNLNNNVIQGYDYLSKTIIVTRVHIFNILHFLATTKGDYVLNFSNINKNTGNFNTNLNISRLSPLIKDFDVITNVFKYNNDKTIIIDSVCEYLNIILSEKSEKEKIKYFRGMSDISYECIPGIYRDNNFEKELFIFREFKSMYLNQFGNKTNIELLTTMQHYGCPTRLLDYTKNPLVSLYFACLDNKYTLGRVVIETVDRKDIKYVDSNMITILSSLTELSTQEKTNLMQIASIAKDLPELEQLKYKKDPAYQKFLQIITKHNHTFVDKINFKDLLNNYFVNVGNVNDRIIAQSGAFKMFGLTYEMKTNKVLNLFMGKSSNIFVRNKKKILEELNLLNINESTLFADMSNVSKYITKVC